MRLNGIHAEPGTIIGMDDRTGIIVAVQYTMEEETEEGCPTGRVAVALRNATDAEIQPEAFLHAPRSIAEHTALPTRITPYGPAKMFGEPPKVREVDARSALHRLKQYDPLLAQRLALGGKSSAAPKIIVPKGGRHRAGN